VSNAQQVRALVRQVLEQVDALAPPVMREILPVLAEARRELETGIGQWIRRVPGGEAAFTPKHMRLAMMQIRAAEDAIRRGVPVIRGALERGGRDAAMLARRWTGEELTRFSRMFDGQALPPINLPAIEHLLTENKWLITQYESSAQRYGRRQRLWLRRQFAIGVAKGETMDQLTRRISGGSLRAVVGTDAVARGMADHMLSVAHADAERLVRTEMNNTFNAHHQTTIEAVAEDTPGMRKRWDATGDNRLCVLCRSLDRVTIAPGATFAGGYTHPPAHPHCRCVLVAWMEDWPEIGPTPRQRARQSAIERANSARERSKQQRRA
jgi:SPP1 gp7 family putative phage head morphogenesis protein